MDWWAESGEEAVERGTARVHMVHRVLSGGAQQRGTPKVLFSEESPHRQLDAPCSQLFEEVRTQ